MKCPNVRRIVVTGLVVALICVNVSTPVHAQSAGLIVRIPFDFYVGSNKLPAGQYEFHRGSNSLVRIAGDRTHANVLTMPIALSKPLQNGAIVFRKYANDYFLSEVRWTDNFVVAGLSPSKFETQLARNIGVEQALLAGTRP